MKNISYVKLKIHNPNISINGYCLSGGFPRIPIISQKCIIHNDWVYSNFDCVELSGYIVIEREIGEIYDDTPLRYRIVSETACVTNTAQHFILSKYETISNKYLKGGNKNSNRIIENNMYITMPDFLVSDYMKWILCET